MNTIFGWCRTPASESSLENGVASKLSLPEAVSPCLLLCIVTILAYSSRVLLAHIRLDSKDLDSIPKLSIVYPHLRWPSISLPITLTWR